MVAATLVWFCCEERGFLCPGIPHQDETTKLEKLGRDQTCKASGIIILRARIVFLGNDVELAVILFLMWKAP